MQNTSLVAAGVALLGLGLVAANPALALPTPEQAAAEGFVQPTPGATPEAGAVVAPAAAGDPAMASNGKAQQRITTSTEQDQQ